MSFLSEGEMMREIKYPEEIKMESARRAVEKMEKAREQAAGNDISPLDSNFCAECGRRICKMCAIYDEEPLCPACYVYTRIGGRRENV